MQSISNADILDMLLFVEERINTTIERCGSVISVNDFLASPDKMDIFDATCMRLQTIGETVKNIDNLTNHELLINYGGALLDCAILFLMNIYLLTPKKFLK